MLGSQKMKNKGKKPPQKRTLLQFFQTTPTAAKAKKPPAKDDASGETENITPNNEKTEDKNEGQSKKIKKDDEEEDEKEHEVVIKATPKPKTSTHKRTSSSSGAAVKASKPKKKKRVIESDDDDECDYCPEADANDDDDDDDYDGGDDASESEDDVSEYSDEDGDYEPKRSSRSSAKKAPNKKETFKTPNRKSVTSNTPSSSAKKPVANFAAFSAKSTPNNKTTSSFGSTGSGAKRTPSSSISASKPSTSASKTSFAQKNSERYEWLVDIRDKHRRKPDDPEYDKETLFVPQSAYKKFTNFERQYWDIKKDNWDAIVFFKKGKFYELFEKDADIGQKEFDLKMTERTNMKMVGVPEKTFVTWASKFIALGYKVAKVDESENSLQKSIRENKTNAKKEKVIHRELKCILTSGTLVGDMVVDEMANYIMAIKEENLQFGIAFVDCSTGIFYITSFSDDQSRSVLKTILVQTKPKELILEKGIVSQETLRTIKNCLVNPIVNKINPESEFYSSSGAIEQLRYNGFFDEKEKEEEKNITLTKYKEHGTTMSAVGAILFYLDRLHINSQVMPQATFKPYDPLKDGQSLLMDGQCLQNLEVLQNTATLGQEGTLFQLLNHCTTPFGKRLFKQWISHPLVNVDKINDRYDAVEDFRDVLNDSDLLRLDKVPDLERMLARLSGNSCKPSDFILVLENLASLFKEIQDMQTHLPRLKSSTLRRILTIKSDDDDGLLPDISETLNFFLESFDMERTRNEGRLIPEPGVDEEYDEANSNLVNLDMELNDHLQEIKDELKDHKLAYKNIGKDTFQIEIKATVKVPKTFILKSQTKAMRRYWTTKIQDLVPEYAIAKQNFAQASDNAYSNLVTKFSVHHKLWQSFLSCISTYDCLKSLYIASLSMDEPICRPTPLRQDTPYLELKNMRHPCLSNISSDYIPNDAHFGGEKANAMLLTGPNMGGKSTFLRQTCMAVIMAQIGCFVTADSVKFTPVDRIFTRIGANDNIMSGQSTFMVELDETSTILKHATNKSLVILDELGRGTSTYDGYSIAYSVMKYLIDRIGCITLFSTHYHLLCDELLKEENITLNHMTCHVDEEKRDITFLYKIGEGSCPKSYGLNVARMAGLSTQLLDRADAKAEEFEMNTSNKHFSNLEIFKTVMSGLDKENEQLIRKVCQRLKQK